MAKGAEVEIPEHLKFSTSLTNHEIVRDKLGTLRYKAKPIIKHIAKLIDLTELNIAYGADVFDLEAYMQLVLKKSLVRSLMKWKNGRRR
jgi:hypothetical protein